MAKITQLQGTSLEVDVQAARFAGVCVSQKGGVLLCFFVHILPWFDGGPTGKIRPSVPSGIGALTWPRSRVTPLVDIQICLTDRAGPVLGHRFDGRAAGRSTSGDARCQRGPSGSSSRLPRDWLAAPTADLAWHCWESTADR